MKISFFAFVCVLALFREAYTFPLVAKISSLADVRSDEQHPLDLFKAGHLQKDVSNDNDDFFIIVNRTEVSGTGTDWVTVSWGGVRRPTENDLIALYPAIDNWREKTPIKSLYAAESSTHLTEGRGSFEARMLNHRTDVKFVFVREFIGIPRYIGESEIIKMKDKDYPLGVHLALTDTKNEILVQWISAEKHTPIVKWGTKSGDYNHQVEGKSITYTADELCGRPATHQGYIFPGYFHSAVITDLQPGKMYYYIFGNEVSGFSEEYSFKGPVPVGGDDTIKIIGIADMGQYNVDYFDNPKGYEPSLQTTTNINLEEDVDLVVHVGDISYAQGYVADWDVFFDQLLPLTSKVPYMTVIGNHERMYPGSGDRYNVGQDSGGECGVAYERRLQMPSQGPDKSWYSFEFGPIHFLIFSTEQDFEPGSEQYAFMQKDLDSIDRERTPWVIVCFHRPMYPGITKDSPPRGYWYVGQELQRYLADLFFEKGVDMLWSGHHHSYQRTCPVHHEKCVESDPDTGEARAPVQVIFANTGARLYTNLRKRPFIEFQRAEFGYARFTANKTSLSWEAVRNSDRTVMDSAVLVKAPKT